VSSAAALAVPSGPRSGTSARRVFDSVNRVWMLKVFPGEFEITHVSDEALTTVLGSCVSACIRDPDTGIGGMNHFMLAKGDGSGWDGDPQSTRYGNFAMEKLINELLKRGCSRQSLEIKVFGGGNVTDTRNQIGTQNAEFVLQYLRAEGLSCVAQDLGGTRPRRIQYFPSTGRVVRRLLAGTESSAILRDEASYALKLKANSPAGEIELFE
jgi:chemotaxis protein CheD